MKLNCTSARSRSCRRRAAAARLARAGPPPLRPLVPHVLHFHFDGVGALPTSERELVGGVHERALQELQAARGGRAAGARRPPPLRPLVPHVLHFHFDGVGALPTSERELVGGVHERALQELQAARGGRAAGARRPPPLRPLVPHVLHFHFDGVGALPTSERELVGGVHERALQELQAARGGRAAGARRPPPLRPLVPHVLHFHFDGVGALPTSERELVGGVHERALQELQAARGGRAAGARRPPPLRPLVPHVLHFHFDGVGALPTSERELVGGVHERALQELQAARGGRAAGARRPPPLRPLVPHVLHFHFDGVGALPTSERELVGGVHERALQELQAARGGRAAGARRPPPLRPLVPHVLHFHFDGVGALPTSERELVGGVHERALQELQAARGGRAAGARRPPPLRPLVPHVLHFHFDGVGALPTSERELVGGVHERALQELQAARGGRAAGARRPPPLRPLVPHVLHFHFDGVGALPTSERELVGGVHERALQELQAARGGRAAGARRPPPLRPLVPHVLHFHFDGVGALPTSERELVGGVHERALQELQAARGGRAAGARRPPPLRPLVPHVLHFHFDGVGALPTSERELVGGVHERALQELQAARGGRAAGARRPPPLRPLVPHVLHFQRVLVPR
ncbi:hypothetical protein ACJJTC_019179 [Scirpophaga incertulas]